MVITDRGPVDGTVVLCCWKHLAEVSTLCSQATTLEVVAAELCPTASPWNSRLSIHAYLFQTCLSECLFLSHLCLSVRSVLGGGGVCGGGVVGQGAPAARS